MQTKQGTGAQAPKRKDKTMQYIITYSSDRARHIDDWTEEVYNDQEKAEQTALDLLYSGYYVTLYEQDNAN